MVQCVTDLADPRLAAFHVDNERALRASGRFVCEGPLVVGRLVESRFEVETVLATPRKADLAEAAAARGAAAFVADDEIMRQIRGFDFHRGVVAVGRGDLPTAPGPVPASGLVLACAGVEDAENLGALVRLAAGFGCAAVWLDGRCHDPLYRRVIRVSMGHALRLPICRVDDLPSELRRADVPTVAAVLAEDAVPLRDVPGGGGAVLVVGNEAAGVPADVAGACQTRATIPMAGGVDSLNVAVAAGIFLHHLRGG